jgi:hypothetical protein
VRPFFADTYALLAWLSGEPAYVRRFERATYTTGWLNLMECHFFQISKGIPEADAARRLAPMERFATHPDWTVLRRASTIRRRMIEQGRRCSYVDSIGYAAAQSAKVPFLAGDGAFRGLEGVEFLAAAVPTTGKPPTSRQNRAQNRRSPRPTS